MQQEMQAGWEFSSKQMGAEYAAHIGDAYIHEVDATIEKLVKDMQELGANNLGVKQFKHSQLTTVQLIMVKRGVIGVNKIGYVS